MRKGFILPLVIVIVALVAVAGAFYLAKKSSGPTATNPVVQQEAQPSSSPTLNTPPITTRTIHGYPLDLYGFDKTKSINKTHIISFLFIPKNISTTPKPEWFENMKKTNNGIKFLFEREFENNIEITYTVVSNEVHGVNNIEEYTPWSLAKEGRELTEKYAKEGYSNIWMLYLVRDNEYKQNLKGGSLGGAADLQSATQFEYWLDNDAVNSSDPFGIKGSAHEFGHALGMPHPWELPGNKTGGKSDNSYRGDVMGYVNNGLKIDQLFVDSEMKKAMGL
jgi:hypothetical protein